MRPWEEALFINNYNFFVELHYYLFACNNEVSALGAESLSSISTDSWRACIMQASLPTRQVLFPVQYLISVTEGGRTSKSKIQIGSFL